MSTQQSRSTLGLLWRSPRGIFALSTLGLLALTALVSLFWLPVDPNHANIYQAWDAPSAAHWLGTDNSGRDIASRLIAGSQVTVLVVLGAAAVSSVIGLLLAILSGLGPRPLREPLIILIDVLIAFPTLLLAIMLTAVFGSGIPVIIVSVGIGFGVQIARVVRAELRQIGAEDFVLAARAAGLSRWQILRMHLLPNAAPVFVVQLSLCMGLAILAEAGLSFLGFGAPADVPSWGRMLQESQAFISVHPLVVLWPGITITVTVLAFYLLGDALREVMDPRLRFARPRVKGKEANRAE
ncbi:ABC transporter permease [Leucobacter sp. UT-8R-CII-1-4]|uniref:ABC transporter permease n=1 Tax=Leucobacter sp. UT-8R-CII-1-4 TaxID=3040075 RepID=UPI0024A7EB8A|nr:ABC transporter permease [Leucobacter sp. UT-8R-CII-1-4]MDI6022072.1 ABC transporter permease [Leucobacter sp. UT-8R-CII-1-4]